MKPLLSLLVCVVVVTCATLPLFAEPVSLESAYQRALEYDAQLGVAEADNKIYREEREKAFSQFRPSIRLGAARGVAPRRVRCLPIMVELPLLKVPTILQTIAFRFASRCLICRILLHISMLLR